MMAEVVSIWMDGSWGQTIGKEKEDLAGKFPNSKTKSRFTIVFMLWGSMLF